MVYMYFESETEMRSNLELYRIQNWDDKRPKNLPDIKLVLQVLLIPAPPLLVLKAIVKVLLLVPLASTAVKTMLYLLSGVNLFFFIENAGPSVPIMKDMRIDFDQYLVNWNGKEHYI